MTNASYSNFQVCKLLFSFLTIGIHALIMIRYLDDKWVWQRLEIDNFHYQKIFAVGRTLIKMYIGKTTWDCKILVRIDFIAHGISLLKNNTTSMRALPWKGEGNE
jgi:hypothetical protein